MQQADFQQFSSMISAVGDLYGKPQSEVAISIWWNALKHLELSTVRESLSKHVQNPDTGQWMPKPADLIRLIGGTTRDKAELAWSSVDQAVRQIGTYRDVEFDDAIIHFVLRDMGGWTRLGKYSEDEFPFVKNEFINRYRGYASRGLPLENKPELVGLINTENRARGLLEDASKRRVRQIADYTPERIAQ